MTSVMQSVQSANQPTSKSSSASLRGRWLVLILQGKQKYAHTLEGKHKLTTSPSVFSDFSM